MAFKQSIQKSAYVAININFYFNLPKPCFDAIFSFYKSSENMKAFLQLSTV